MEKYIFQPDDKNISLKVVNATRVCPEGAYFAVKHLFSCNNVQLDTEKVIPGERQKEKESDLQLANTALSKA